MKRAAAFVVVLLLMSGLIGGLYYFQFIMKPQIIKQVIGSMKPGPTAVAFAEAKTESWVPRITAIGSFRPVQGIDVAPQVGGIVRTVKFDSAQEVAKGAALVEIDDSTEQADLQSGIAQMKNADLSLTRQKELISGGNTAKATVDQAQAARDTAAASVDRARAVIAQKALSAPFAGRLGIRRVDVGQYVSPGTALVTLTQLDPIFVDFPVPEQSLAVLKTGADTDISVDAYPGQIFKGKIKSIDARVSQDSRSVLIRAELPNPDRRLLPGMFADVAVLAGAARETVTVPRTAVTYSLYGDSLYVATPVAADKPNPQDGAATAVGSAQAAPSDAPGSGEFVVQQRFVRTGDVRGDSIAVLEGLKPGETVVTEGQIKLMPNAHVRGDPAAGMRPRTTLPKE